MDDSDFTPYDAALALGRKIGAARCNDSSLMAMCLDATAQQLLGAVSPKLIYTGAQRRGMTTLALMTLMKDDPYAARDLMWED